MTIEVLVATMNQEDDWSLPIDMNIQSDAIIGNQCGRNEIKELEYNGHRIKSRNTVHLDHLKRFMPIAGYGSSRSPQTVHADHQIRSKPISFGGGIL